MTSRFDENHELPQLHQASTTDMELTFAPINSLESALIETENGRLDQREFFKIFVASEVYQIAATPQAKDSPIFPLAFHDPEHGRMIAVFSALCRANTYRDQAPLLLPLRGAQVFEQIPAGYGVVLNPGSPVSLTIPGYGVLNLRRDFGIRRVTL